MGPCNAKEKPTLNQNQQAANTEPLPTEQRDAFNFNEELVHEKIGKITQDYTMLLPPMGKGSFGEVRKALQKSTGIIRAIKIISKMQLPLIEQSTLVSEVNILKTLDHPNIIKVYEFYQDKNFFYIVSELCTGGELFDRISSEKIISEGEASNIINQILCVLNYCHSKGVMHRDLKPENLLYDTKGKDQVLKVIDFGTAKTYNFGEQFTQPLGTPYYIAPEVLEKNYNFKCDIWSCGVILYIILCGYPPFDGKNNEEIIENIKIGQPKFDKSAGWKAVSSEAIDLVKKMLTVDPEKRPDAQECISHKWIQKTHIVSEQNNLENCLQNLKKFRDNQRLQEGIYVFIVNYLSTKEQKAQLMKNFNELDTNNDGTLSKEELIAGYRKIMNIAQAEEEVTKIMKAVDRNNSGKIGYTEFVTVRKPPSNTSPLPPLIINQATIDRQQMLSKSMLETTFRIFDKDNSGSIDLDEIRYVFGDTSLADVKAWQDIITMIDKDHNGSIGLSEFKNIMMSLLDIKN